MFGINPQAAGQDTAVVGNFTQESPLDGVKIDDNLQATGLIPQQAIIQPTIAQNPDNPLQQVSFNAPVQNIPATDSTDDELIDIKKDALQQLTPLVGHLDQTPEEKFRTTMMLIQATDDKTLLRSAYQSALQISDEKSKAQALLDVVNEINYFTHPDIN
jgi:hypothetical protein